MGRSDSRSRSKSRSGSYAGSKSRSKSRGRSYSGSHSRSRSRSRSYKGTGRRGRSYSRSYSRSRSRSYRGRKRSYSRSYSRSRSRSRSHKGRRRSYSRSYSRSRSRSPYNHKRHGGGRYGGGGGYYRRRSRSPLSNRKRHVGDRDAPPEGKCLGIFGLSLYTTEREVKEMCDRYGDVDSCQIVYDHATGRSRGFAFVYFKEVDSAVEAKERLNGQELDGRRIRVDFSITQRPHTPTPGVYMGRPTYFRKDEEERGGSRYRRKSYSRSRSR